MSMSDAHVCERYASLCEELDARLEVWLGDVVSLDGDVHRSCGSRSPQVRRSSAAMDAMHEFVKDVRWRLANLLHNVQALAPEHVDAADLRMLTHQRFWPEEQG